MYFPKSKIMDTKTKKTKRNTTPKSLPNPPGTLFDLISNFLVQYGYERTAKELQSEIAGSSIQWKDAARDKPALTEILEEWEKSRKPNNQMHQMPNSSGSDGDSDDDSEDDSEDDSDSEGSDSEVGGIKPGNTKVRGIEVSDNEASDNEASENEASDNEASDSEASDSEVSDSEVSESDFSESEVSDSETSNSDDDGKEYSGGQSQSITTTTRPMNAKETKVSNDSNASTRIPVQKSPHGNTGSDSISKGSESDTESRASDSDTSDSSSSASCSSGSAVSADSSDGSPGSNEKQSSSSSSDTESDASKAINQLASNGRNHDKYFGNQASATSCKSSNGNASAPIAGNKRKRHTCTTKPSSNPNSNMTVLDGGDGNKRAKKSNIPFSRISKDQKVDPRFASNAFVPYAYAQRAHQRLGSSKGKAFTKAKSTGKRGSYRGGRIDTRAINGIKFDH